MSLVCTWLWGWGLLAHGVLIVYQPLLIHFSQQWSPGTIIILIFQVRKLRLGEDKRHFFSPTTCPASLLPWPGLLPIQTGPVASQLSCTSISPICPKDKAWEEPVMNVICPGIIVVLQLELYSLKKSDYCLQSKSANLLLLSLCSQVLAAPRLLWAANSWVK